MEKGKAAVCAYAPVAQEMHEAPWPSQQDLQEWRQRLDVKEAELQAALERLEQCQQHAQSLAAKGVATVVDVTVVDVDPDADATIPANRQGGSTTLQLLQQERSMLLARWQCLLEERKQLTAAMKLLATGQLRDFEPGDTPLRNVFCAVVTHQFDAPCLSCCFQR